MFCFYFDFFFFIFMGFDYVGFFSFFVVVRGFGVFVCLEGFFRIFRGWLFRIV